LVTVSCRDEENILGLRGLETIFRERPTAGPWPNPGICMFAQVGFEETAEKRSRPRCQTQDVVRRGARASVPVEQVFGNGVEVAYKDAGHRDSGRRSRAWWIRAALNSDEASSCGRAISVR